MSTEKRNDREKKDPGVEEEVSIHGDLLEIILSQVPLINLAPACHVSRSWNRAVFSSLNRVRRIKPWLIVYVQSKRSPYASSARAYDPRSHLWIEIKPASPIEPVSAVRSSHSAILYTISPSKFSFSVDPLHLKWRHVDAPRVWRKDPVVAVVGHSVIVAGGAGYFEDDGLAVEVLDTETGAWETCQSMPAQFKDSAAATWLSVAANAEKMYVTEKRSCTAYSFDRNTRSWSGPFDLRMECEDDGGEVYSRVIGFLGDRLIMAGASGDDENPKAIKVWEITGACLKRFKLIGSMPSACFEKLKGEDSISSPLTSIALNAVGGMVYIHNSEEPAEIVAAEMVDGMLCNWTSLSNERAREKSVLAVQRLIFTCSNVGLRDLRSALRENCSFLPFTHNQ